jgi:aminoethylphosphonate catabolism LysR family transcriptional regulator
MLHIGLFYMRLTQLRAFHLVARDRSFTAAARSAGVSQPTISGQVRALEDSYRVRLFERRARGARLTELGQRLCAVTNRLCALEEEALSVLSGAKLLARGHLRIAADSAYHVMPVLAELRTRHQGVTFSLAIGNSAAVLKQLLDFEAEVAVMAKTVSDPRLHSLGLRRDELILFVPRDHAWANRRRLKLKDLAGQSIVLRERGSITREMFEQALADSAIRPGSIIDVQTREGVREAVAAGFGIGVVFHSEFGNDARFAPLAVADAKISVAEYAVCLQENLRLGMVRAFMDAASALAAGKSAAKPN